MIRTYEWYSIEGAREDVLAFERGVTALSSAHGVSLEGSCSDELDIRDDWVIDDQGTVVVLTPVSNSAKAWTKTHEQVGAWARVGDGFACEPRYVDDLLSGFLSSVGEEEESHED